jgi:hypothetical protein
VVPLMDALQHAVRQTITRRNYWLAAPPPGVIEWVWQAPCLAAAAALRRMWTMLNKDRQQLSHQPPSAAVAAAQSHFWQYVVEL